MTSPPEVDDREIRRLLDRKPHMLAALSICVSCGLCADSCFLYVHRQKRPDFMPSYKVIFSLGVLVQRKGRVTRTELAEMGNLVWHHCVLCGRCHCPVGISIPDMIAWTRTILRSQGISREHDTEGEGTWTA